MRGGNGWKMLKGRDIRCEVGEKRYEMKIAVKTMNERRQNGR